MTPQMAAGLGGDRLFRFLDAEDVARLFESGLERDDGQHRIDLVPAPSK
jgi:hypothetical protein